MTKLCALGFILQGLLALSVLAFAADVEIDPSKGFCRDGWTYAVRTNACYKAVFEAATWNYAYKACLRWNATLPIIHDRKTEKALHDFAAKYVRLEYFHIGLRRASGVQLEWRWIDGSEVDYANYECWQETLGADGPQCVSAPLGAGSPPCVWRPVECYPTKLPYICVAPAAQLFPSTDASTSEGPQPNTTAPAHTVTEGKAGAGNDEGSETDKNCEDAVASWKCKTLKTIYACKASKYISYPEKNCAKTCGLCK